MPNSKLNLTFVALSDHDKDSNVSYIRKTRPDYMLEVRGAGLHLEDSLNSELFYSLPIDCCFFLNYGDLFLSVVNAMESHENIEQCISWLANTVMRKKENLDEAIRKSAYSKGKKALDASLIQRLNAEYRRYETALSFATILAFAIFEDQKKEGYFGYALTELLTSPDNPESYGALSAVEFQKNLKSRNLFTELSVKISYSDYGETYSFSDFYNLLGFEIRQMIGKHSEIKVCKNCGRFFIPAKRRDEKYCDNIFQDLKTCKQVAFSIRVDKDEVLKAYRKIYKTQNARKQRNGHKSNIATNFDLWATFAKNRLTQCQNGEITLQTMIRDISGSEWMSGNISQK